MKPAITDIDAERVAWRAYVRYVHMRARGNRASTFVFLGDDRSHELWRAWAALYAPIVAARTRCYKRKRRATVAAHWADGINADQRGK